VIEFWRVLRGEAAGRERPDQVTVFDSVGFALEDYSALRYLHSLAQSRKVGTQVALIPPSVDPKNLFDTLARSNAPDNVPLALNNEAMALSQ
jgi:ornithine cyclodeaminase